MQDVVKYNKINNVKLNFSMYSILIFFKISNEQTNDGLKDFILMLDCS